MQLLDLRESRTRGSFDFPVELYEISPQHPRYQMSYHWHPEPELIWVRAGRLSYMIDDVAGQAGPGAMLFVNGGGLHAGTPGENCRYDCVVFDPDLLGQHGEAGEVLRRFSDHSLLVDTVLPQSDAQLAGVVRGVFEAMAARGEGYKLLVRGLLLQFFGLVLARGCYGENMGRGHGALRKTQQLKQVLALVETDYERRLTLEDLAEEAGMSPKYFCHFFRGMTGRTPVDYLNHHRIEIAASRFALGEGNITEVAYDCGFNDLSYFIRVFKRYKQVTPKQYCKAFRGMAISAERPAG